MKKRRSKVYVSPGKDVTLYVPTETPPEVIHYLNHLKDEGMFSQGVMEIITRYVKLSSTPAMPTMGHTARTAEPVQPEPDWIEVSPVDSMPGSAASTTGNKLSLTEIFQQARRNSGKLINAGDHN